MDIFDLNAIFDLINISLQRLKQERSWFVSKDEYLEIVVVHKKKNFQSKFDIKQELPVGISLHDQPLLVPNQIEAFSDIDISSETNQINASNVIDERISSTDDVETANDTCCPIPSLASTQIAAFNDDEMNGSNDQNCDDPATDGADIDRDEFTPIRVRSRRSKTKGAKSRYLKKRSKGTIKDPNRQRVGRLLLFSEMEEDDLGQFPCPYPFCSKSYQQSKEVVSHCKKNHSLVSFRCSECPMQFNERFELTFHKDTVHNDNAGKFACGVCGMKFHSRKGLTHHTNRGHPESAKREAFKCAFCAAKFDSQYDKQQHVYQNHKDRIFFCQYCRKPSFGEKSLECHIKLVHKDVLLGCPFCEKKFTTSDSLSYHQDEHHDDIETGVDDKPHVCALVGCQKRFRTPLNLELHNKIHEASKARLETMKNSADRTSSKDEKGPCETCGELVPTKRMREHKLQHTVRPHFKCSDCDKVFHWKNKLKQHYLAKHVKRELKCPIESCGKVFYVRNVLNAHVKGVHGTTREQCPSCEKSFSFRADLATHIRAVHEGKMSYCSVCMKEFPRNADRNRHERQVHKVGGPKTADNTVSNNF